MSALFSNGYPKSPAQGYSEDNPPYHTVKPFRRNVTPDPPQKGWSDASLCGMLSVQELATERSERMR